MGPVNTSTGKIEQAKQLIRTTDPPSLGACVRKAARGSLVQKEVKEVGERTGETDEHDLHEEHGVLVGRGAPVLVALLALVRRRWPPER